MIEVVFFDLGNTLVTGNRSWIAGAKETVHELSARDKRLGIISNTGNLSRDDILGRLPTDFDLAMFAPELVLLSSEIGIEKPSLSIFLEATRRAATPPARCLFCTEDLHHTLVAQLAGMRTARVVPGEGGDIGELARILESSGQI